MSKFSRRITLVVMATILSSAVAFAERGEGEVLFDYNLGGGLMINGEPLSTSRVASATVGGAGSVEFTMLAEPNQRHFLVLDGRALVFIGGGAAITANGQPVALFSLRMIGSVTGGFQAFRVIPLNVALDDLDFRVDNSEVQARALLGGTIYLPVSLLTRIDGANLYIGMTYGARLHTGRVPAFGFQPRIRFIRNNLSVEGRYVFTVGGVGVEHRGIVQLGFNNVFREGDQIGAYVAAGYLTDGAGRESVPIEGIVFYGASF